MALDVKRATGKYQLISPLSPEDFAALEADIMERGVLSPIEFDEDGNVLDGHHRLMICDKHKITDYPKIVRKGWSEEQKRTHARRMNLARRHLTREQRRKLIEDELRERPESTDRKIAAALGVDHKTVGVARGHLEAGGEIPHVDVSVGLNNKPFTRTTVRRSAAHAKEAPVDANGQPVPDHLADVFRDVAEFRSLENMLVELKRRMIDLETRSPGMKDSDHLIRRHLEGLEMLLAENLPNSVHRPCKGQGCKVCRNRGFTVGGDTPQDTPADTTVSPRAADRGARL